MKVWKTLLLALVVLVCATGTIFTQPAAAAAAGKVFINLTSDDTQRAAMALGMAMNLKAAGNDVTLFLNIEGVRVASSGVKQMKHWLSNKTPRQLLADAMAQNITVIICPMCMQWAGVKQGQILPGILISSPTVTYPALMDPATKTLSY